MVAVACFLPGRAKDLSITPRTFVICRRFEFLMAMKMKLILLWKFVPCSLLEMYLHFGQTCLVSHQDMRMCSFIRADSSTETSLNF